MSHVKTISFPEAINSLNILERDRNLFSSPDWLFVLHKTYDLNLHVKFIEENGAIVSYVVYSLVKNFLEWKICVCSYCDYFDGNVKSVDHWHQFFQSFREDYPEYRIAIRSLRYKNVQACPDFNFLSKEYFHFLDIQDSIENLEQRLYQNFKGACQQAVKRGVTVRVCKKKDLYHFYKLHFQLRKNKFRLFAQPYVFFENIWDKFMPQDKGFLLGAFDPSGNMIGANMYLICGDTLYYKFATSSQNSLEYRPNNLLIWTAIKMAKERGLKFIDLGSSGTHQTGLINFKMRICQGVEQMEIRHLGYAPPQYKFSRKIILSQFTKICTHPWTPDLLTEWGSKIIYPYLA